MIRSIAPTFACSALASLAFVGMLACSTVACTTSSPLGDSGTGGEGGESLPSTSATAGVGATSGGAGGSGEEMQPEPAAGEGVADPVSRSLHGHGCNGTDWQLVDGWLLLPHKDVAMTPDGEIERCQDRYAGWVTNEADAAQVSRGSVYAALDATGQCDDGKDYDGALLSGPLCVSVHPDLDEASCLASMQSSRAFGIRTVAQVLALPANAKKHENDPPLMAAFLSHGSVACGGTDAWKLDAPTGFVDRYVHAYNAYRALGDTAPKCKKRLIVSVALYTGMDDPGVGGVERANGCWTYERVSKTNDEWKICGYDGSVEHPDGVKWAYDDTNTDHSATLDTQRIQACKSGVPGRGYVYMTNRGSGWPQRVTTGVRVHFAELYSGQFTVDDQFGLWKSAGTPGDPMINVGEASTSASHIHDATLNACKQVPDGEYVGVYVYPESLRTSRMSALVHAMNECTE